MVRGFTEDEKKAIKLQLMKEGRELFARFGLKKTSIAELAKAAGISTSAFYNFFESKEELYSAIFEEEEQRLHEQAMEIMKQGGEDNFQKALLDLLMIGKEVMTKNPFIRQLMLNGDMAHLMRKLPKKDIDAHLLRDYDQFAPVLKHLQSEGKVISADSKVLVTIFQLYFLLHLHRKEFDPEVFDQAVELLAQWIAGGMAGKNNENEPK